MTDRPNDRHRSSRSRQGSPQARSGPRGSSRREWDNWDDASDRDDRSLDDTDWGRPAARRNAGSTRKPPQSRGSASARSRDAWDAAQDDDDWSRDDVDDWSPPRSRNGRNSQNSQNGHNGHGPSRPADRYSARDAGRDAGRGGVHQVPNRAASRGAARGYRERVQEWADTVERWGETSRQWVVSAAHNVLTGEWQAVLPGRAGRDKARDAAETHAKSPRIALLVVILLLLACPVLSGLQLGLVYLQARDGLQHLKNAQADLSTLSSHPFDAAALAQIQGEFASAYADFSSASAGAQRTGFLGAMPIAGSKLAGAQRLLPIAAEATQAGMIGFDAISIIAPKMKNPFDTTGAGITADDLKAVSQRFAQVKPLVDQIITQVGQLQPSDLDLDPRLGPLVASMQDKLPQIKQIVADVQATLDVAGSLLGVGTPANYLLEVLDSTELRPGGGFIGNYGFITLSGGHLGGIKMQDVDLLDHSVKYGTQNIALPKGYDWFNGVFNGRWGFRDSNLDGDFPTSAKYGEHLYDVEDGSVTPVGVVAITPWLIKSALAITGPITLPEYNNLQITPDNLVDEIHYYQLTNGVPKGPDSVYDPECGSSKRKCFTGYLFKHFMAQVKSESSKDMGPLVKVLLDGLHSKDVQIYLNPAPAEDILVQTHLASTIQAPTTGDSFFAVDANIIANKSNYVISQTLSDQVTIDDKGTAAHHTVLKYIWPKDPKTLQETYPSLPANVDHLVEYQRIYVPPTAKAQGRYGWYMMDSGSAFNRQVWGGRLSVTYANTTTLAVDWTSPGVATHDASGWHYQYLMQKQAGVTDTIDVKITLPSCAQIAAVPSGFKATDPHTVTLAPQPFTADSNISLNYTC